MTTLVASTPSSGLGGGRRITRAGLAGLVIAAIGVVVVLFAVTPMQGRADFVITAGAAVLVAVTVVSLVVEGRRRAVDRIASTVMTTAFVIAVLPLALVLYYVAAKGITHLSATFFTHSQAGVAPNLPGGGIYHAIVGTVEQVGIATIVSVPIGLLTAIYVNEYGRGLLARATRFVVDVMTGIPSIVAGLFVFTFFVVGLHAGYSGFAGSIALAIIQLPVLIRVSEDMLHLVPDTLREAAYGLGLPRWRVIVSIVLPTASAGITTGVMLAIARITGETAPLLLTAFDSSYINYNPFHGTQSALSLIIFDQAQQAYAPAVNRAWATAFTLIAIVVILYVLARLLTRRNRLVAR